MEWVGWAAVAALLFALLLPPSHRYYWSVLEKAWQDTSAFWKRSTIGVGLVAAALRGVVEFGPTDAARNAALNDVSTAFAVGFGLVGISFFANLLMAPVRLHEAQQGRIRTYEAESAFTITPLLRGTEFLLEVKNEGPPGDFGAKVLLLAGVEDPLSHIGWEIAWLDRPDQVLRRIGSHGDTALPNLCTVTGPLSVDFDTVTGAEWVRLKGHPVRPPDEKWESEKAIVRIRVYRNDPYVPHEWGVAFVSMFLTDDGAGAVFYRPEVIRMVQHA